jgi:phage terminase large subunit-like protein
MVVNLVLPLARDRRPGPSRGPQGIHAQTATSENGFVNLPNEAAWLAEYPHELTVFPKGKRDDQVDSTAQMLDCCKRA